MARLATRENGEKYVNDDWDGDDVLSVADDLEVNLTPEQVEAVLTLMAKSFDATIGINWDVIEICIQTVLGE
jgi:hypothetical protein